MKNKWVLVILILALLVFNLFSGSQIATLYIGDTIYATTYFGLSMLLVGVSILFYGIVFIVKFYKNCTKKE
jgi:predicted phage tail protein